LELKFVDFNTVKYFWGCWGALSFTFYSGDWFNN